VVSVCSFAYSEGESAPFKDEWWPVREGGNRQRCSEGSFSLKPFSCLFGHALSRDFRRGEGPWRGIFTEDSPRMAIEEKSFRMRRGREGNTFHNVKIDAKASERDVSDTLHSSGRRKRKCVPKWRVYSCVSD